MMFSASLAPRLATIPALLLAIAAAGAHAETVYRCGSAYSQAPCPQPTAVDVTDGRTETQRTDSLRVTAAQKRLGDQMQGDRLAEAAKARTAPASLSGTPAKPRARPSAKKLKLRKKPKKAADST
jgi:hypothetical protein